MKKTAVLIALVLLLLGAFTLCASAEIVDSGDCGDNLTWTLDDAGTLTISGTGDMTSSPWRDDYQEQIKTVILENGVTSIDGFAFYNCTGLTSVTIPDSVTSIDGFAFYYCTGLGSITVSAGNPNYVSVNNCLIKKSSKTLILGCKNSVISADGSVTSIGSYAFSGCTGLKSITIPDSITRIDNYAFSDCTGLTSITIPDSVTSIGGSAFSGCTGLTSVTIGNSVTSIGWDVFEDCTGLGSITVSAGNPNYVSVNNCLIEKSSKTLILGCKNSVIPADGSVTSIGGYAFYNCTGLTSITIPNSVTSIGNSAFSGCTGLTSVTIGNRVTSIGGYAFYNCTGLTSITIPDSVTDIGYAAFVGCTGLTSVTIGNSVTSIGEFAFEDCTGLTSVTIGNSVTDIGYAAFRECTGLTSVTIPDSVTSIGDSAFRDCTGLTSVTIGNSVKSIGDSAFSYCTGLTSVTIPDSVTSIGRYAFYNCTGLTSVTIGISVTSIGEYAFWDCTGLTSITIPNSVTSIGNSAFSGCEGLTSITIPDSVTDIGYAAFVGCTGLTSVTIPDSVTSIGWAAFKDCTGLTSVMIGNGVTSIGESAFSGCTGLGSITVSAGNPNYVSVNNCLIEKSSKTLILGCTNSVIPADGSVTVISWYAFSGCAGLKSITIPNSVTIIGEYAFWGCTGLTSVTIPKNVTHIGDHAFLFCENLKYVFYSGTEAAWYGININRDGNTCLFGAAFHYLSTGDHAWDNGTVKTSATCKQTGVKAYACTCTGCDGVKTESIPKTNHSYKNVITKATFTADGKSVPTCTICGETKPATKINKISKAALAETKFVYNGTVVKPAIIVTDSAGKTISSKYYTEKWSNDNSYAVGTYTVTLTFKGNYSGSKTLTYTVVPKKVTGVKNASPATKSIKLSWTKATGAKYYEVYGSADGKTFKKITTVSTNSAKITKVNGKALAAGKTYYFKVRAMDGTKKLIGAYSSVLKTGTLTAAPKITKLTSAKSKTATVKWGKVTGAKKYVVYKSTDGKKWTKAGTATGTSLTLKNLTGGKKIYVKLLAVNAYKANSAYSAAKSVTVKK